MVFSTQNDHYSGPIGAPLASRSTGKTQVLLVGTPRFYSNVKKTVEASVAKNRIVEPCRKVGVTRFEDKRAKPCEVDELKQKTIKKPDGLNRLNLIIIIIIIIFVFLSVMYDIIMSKAQKPACHSVPQLSSSPGWPIEEHLQDLGKQAEYLALWLDCDRHLSCLSRVWAGFGHPQTSHGASKVLRLMDLYDPLCSHCGLWISLVISDGDEHSIIHDASVEDGHSIHHL